MKTKRLLTLLITIISLNIGFAQNDNLSPEEKAKREKNIQAGNPFKKFGYTPKIATLSKGKYLEFHDLDSIVPIGSVLYNVNTNKIVSFKQIDTLELSEATLKPEVISRWFSPDPLAEEFPDWSPYNFVENNPIRYVDPDGLAPVDIVLRGSNNSSITIETDLIDVDVDAGFLVGDLGGNYSFSGNDILTAGLDIVGVIDPTPISDGLAASLEFKSGNYGGALLSGLGIFPYVGDLGKAGKIPKHIKTIKNAIHGNSKASKKVQHGYEIFNKKTGEILEYGISGQKRSKKQIANGGSPRINQKLKKKYNNDSNVGGRVTKDGIKGRKKGLQWEQNQVNKHAKRKGEPPINQKRPKPSNN
ncbi:hypothetical protein [Tenacibaculum amylolyticum]|uniref:hypothetical protein n=1 Tax=Tenacibaculum amylolyticum TaxID=104269 RepID=UPI0038951BC6